MASSQRTRGGRPAEACGAEEDERRGQRCPLRRGVRADGELGDACVHHGCATTHRSIPFRKSPPQELTRDRVSERI